MATSLGKWFGPCIVCCCNCQPRTRSWNSADDDNFTQPGIFWTKVLNEAERTRLVKNIAGHMINAQQFIQKRAVRDLDVTSRDLHQSIKMEVLILSDQELFAGERGLRTSHSGGD